MKTSADVVVARLSAASASFLSESERLRARRFVFDHDRRRFMARRSLLRRLLAERLGKPPQSIELRTGPEGKPEVPDCDLRFNVSHCGDLAVFAFASGREIGVDVEAVRVMPDADSIASRFFSPAERAAYATVGRAERPQAFFNCWTRKEAFVKAIGGGLTIPLHSFEVSLRPGEPAELRRRGWTVESFSPAPGFVAAVVTESRP